MLLILLFFKQSGKLQVQTSIRVSCKAAKFKIGYFWRDFNLFLQILLI